MPAVRLAFHPCPEVTKLATPRAILSKLSEIKELQSKHGQCHLFPRSWTSLHPSTTTMKTSENGKIENDENQQEVWTLTAMQFNTLAQGLSSGPPSQPPFPATISKGNDYGGFTNVKHPEVCLDFSLRRWRLLEVILNLSPCGSNKEGPQDIIDQFNEKNDGAPSQDKAESIFMSLGPDLLGMEEVDHHHSFFQPLLSKFNYDGLFHPKPHSPCVDQGYYSDGCSLFWKKHKFQLISKVCGTYQAGGNQVYLLATLKHVQSGCNVVVVVTHLKAKGGRVNEETRTKQAQELLQVLEEAVQSCRQENLSALQSESDLEGTGSVKAKEPLVLVLGDFNAEPRNENCKSANEEDTAVATCIPAMLSTRRPNQSLHLSSAYPLNLGKNSDSLKAAVPTTAAQGATPYTTWKTRGSHTSKRVIDYIFHNCPNQNQQEEANGSSPMVLPRGTHVLGVPNEHDVEDGLLPSLRYPSDHMMLAAKFVVGDSHPERKIT